MTVLVDTSVWIRFLANRAPFAAALDELLELEEVGGHDFVYGELLIGDRGARGTLLSSYPRMQQALMIPHDDVVGFVRDRRLHDRGIGWVDAHLIASALGSGMRLWTADARLAAVAADLGVGFR